MVRLPELNDRRARGIVYEMLGAGKLAHGQVAYSVESQSPFPDLASRLVPSEEIQLQELGQQGE